MTDVFEIQDDIARAILEALKVRLVGGTDAPLVQAGTSNMEAYHLVLQGRHHWNRRTTESLAKAEACFFEALRLDPEYAEAHGALALTYSVMLDHTDMSHAEIGAKLEDAARTALRLNSDMWEAHAALAMYNMDCIDWTGAERSIRRAIDANPGSATAHQWYSLMLGYQGRIEEARTEIELAQSLDPLSLIILTSAAWPYYYERNYDQAQKQLDRVRKLDPDFPILNLADGNIHRAMGRFDDAGKSFRRLHAIIPRPWTWLLVTRCDFLAGRPDQMVESLERWYEYNALEIGQTDLRDALATGGRDGLLQCITEHLGTPLPQAQPSAAALGALFMSFGNLESAFAWLETGVNPLSPMMRGLAVDPVWDPLRHDPRFSTLLKKLGLPEM
jgi:tetratricopeptide (TPR) repeat protein